MVLTYVSAYYVRWANGSYINFFITTWFILVQTNISYINETVHCSGFACVSFSKISSSI